MKIIRDPETAGVFTMALCIDWGVRRCNVRGCRERPTTIITGVSEEVPTLGLCEPHFEEGDTPDGLKGTFDFDDFDAFATFKAVAS